MAYVGTPIDTTNQFQSLQGKRFDGDGSTTAFTLDIAPSSVFDIEVFVENVRQDPNSAYSLSGTTLTFAAAPPSGTNNIYVVHQAKAVGTISPAAGTVNADSFDNTVISGHTELAALPDGTDELLISDAGTIKRIDIDDLMPKSYAHWRLSGNQDTDSSANITSMNISESSNITISSGTFTITKAGVYHIFYNGTFLATPSSGGERQVGITIKVNDTGISQARDQVTVLESGNSFGSCSCSAVKNLSVGDTIKFQVDQSYAGANVVAYSDLTNGTIVRIPGF